jgi:hypothetical protein
MVNFKEIHNDSQKHSLARYSHSLTTTLPPASHAACMFGIEWLWLCPHPIIPTVSSECVKDGKYIEKRSINDDQPINIPLTRSRPLTPRLPKLSTLPNPDGNCFVGGLKAHDTVARVMKSEKRSVML